MKLGRGTRSLRERHIELPRYLLRQQYTHELPGEAELHAVFLVDERGLMPQARAVSCQAGDVPKMRLCPVVYLGIR